MGEPRIGKTTGVVIDWKDYIGKCLVLDGQCDLSQSMAIHRQPDLYDCVDDLTGPKIFGLFDTGNIQEDWRILERTFDLFGGRRKVNEYENALIYEIGELVLRGLLYQTEWFPMEELPEVLVPKSLVQRQFIKRCAHAATKEELERLSFFSIAQYRRELLPAKRFLQILQHPEIAARDGHDDPVELIRQCNTIIVSGRQASDRAIYMHLLRWLYAGLEYVEKHGPLLICVDESTNFGPPGQGFFTEHVRRAMRMLGKKGLRLVAITQTLQSLSPEVRDEIIDCCDDIYCYRVTSPDTVRVMTEVMSRLDPYEESHTEQSWKSLPDGYDYDGKPRHWQFQESRTHYRSLSEQQMLTAQSIRRLGVGERFSKNHGFQKLPPLEDPLPWGLSNKNV